MLEIAQVCVNSNVIQEILAIFRLDHKVDRKKILRDLIIIGRNENRDYLSNKLEKTICVLDKINNFPTNDGRYNI